MTLLEGVSEAQSGRPPGKLGRKRIGFLESNLARTVRRLILQGLV